MTIYAVRDNIMNVFTDMSLCKKVLMDNFSKDEFTIYKHDMEDNIIVPLDSECWIPEEGRIYRDGFFCKVGERIIPEDEFDGEDCEYGLMYDEYVQGTIVDYGFEEV